MQYLNETSLFSHSSTFLTDNLLTLDFYLSQNQSQEPYWFYDSDRIYNH